ncbi:MAG TPA: hypothetical protein V6C57_04410 [Coleofasciculaceae cyanobacterium]
MQLIYRGEMIHHAARPSPADQKPYALNWRYQVADETYGDGPRPVQVYAPRAINWRWQMATAV